MAGRAPRRVAVAVALLAIVGSAQAAGVALTGASAAAAGLAPSILRLGAPTKVLPDTAGEVTLRSVSCPSPERCESVGVDAAGRAVTAAGSEAAGRWTWSVAKPDPGPDGADTMASVSCPSTSECVAVGSGAMGQAEVATGVLARSTWRWATPSVLAPDAANGGVLTAVSCPTRATCVAVGKDAASQAIVTTGTASGTGWTWTRPAAIPPDPTGGGGLTAVSCAEATSCVAVGSDAAGHAIFTVGASGASGWAWSTATALGTETDALVGVSCASSAWCVAAGNVDGGPSTLVVGRRSAEGWSWGATVVLGAGAGTVAGVACPTEQLCVAAGAGTVGAQSVATFELAHAAGGGLVVSGAQPLASIGPPATGLTAVACAAADSCVAVGGTVDGGSIAVGSKAASSPVRDVRLRAQDDSVLVTWHAPSFDGGARVVSYRAVARPGEASCSVLAQGDGGAHCVVEHLVNGIRYHVTVSADNGIGVSSVTSQFQTVVPTPFQPSVASPLTRAVLSFVASRADVTSVTVYDVSTGQTWRLDPSSVQHTASIVKVEILAALLHDEQATHATMGPSTRELASEMIEDSDNDAAQALYVQVGQEPGLAAFNALVGLTGTTANWAWGYTDTTSLDQARLVRLFAVPNTILTDASREFGLSLLRHVTPDQAWGVSSGPGLSASVALKDGWYPTAPGDWQVNSIGWVDGEGRNYVLAVLTKDNATFGYGVETIGAISTMVWRGLAQVATPTRD
jgi:hypothetical protein